jgi:hypothetical protein
MVCCRGMIEMAGSEHSFALGRQSARGEARALLQELGHEGNTIEPISVPPKIEHALQAFAKADSI